MKNKLLTILAVITTTISYSQKKPYLLIGTYTSGKSEGIYVYDFDTKNGDAQKRSSVKSSNPSYLAVSSNQKFVYAVNENDNGEVVAYSFDKNSGSLQFINYESTFGKNPCYVTTDKNGKWLIAGNYSSGNFAVYALEKDGHIDSAQQVIEHTGYSVNEERQEGPHVHCTVLNKANTTLYVSDLGIDKIMIYNFDNKTGTVTASETPYEMTEPGAGPRHFEIHPNQKFAYLMEELTGSVSAYKVYSDGELELIQNISALPRDFTGAIGSADIHVSPDGNFLYCSNRGESNTIGIFKINTKTGQLTWVGYQSVLGKKPRNFNFDPTGKYLLVANQDSDEVVIFSRDKKTGLLTDTGKRINVPNPVCLKWIQ